MILRGSRHVYRHPDLENQQENKKLQEILYLAQMANSWT